MLSRVNMGFRTLTGRNSAYLPSARESWRRSFAAQASSTHGPAFSSAAGGHGHSHASSPSKSTRCWSCKRPVPCCSYFCPHCDKVLKPAEMESECSKCSYFELLHVPPSFSLDTKSLENNFKKLQMNLHPDKFGARSKEEQELSAVHSSRLNEAFTTLKSPVRRALYILEQKGIDAVEEGKTETDLEILTEAMEYREKLDNAKTPEQLQELGRMLTKVIHDVEKELAAALGDTSQINHSVRTAVRMRYLEKVQEEITEKTRRILDGGKF